MLATFCAGRLFTCAVRKAVARTSATALAKSASSAVGTAATVATPGRSAGISGFSSARNTSRVDAATGSRASCWLANRADTRI
jgi:hypothetical protein